MFKDRDQFQKMADPRLEGNYPKKGLYQALAIAAMCLQEDDSARPAMSEVVSALAFLSSNKSPKAGDEENEEDGGGGGDEKE